jgi:integrase
MATVHITKSIVEQTKPSDTDVVIHDSELKGFHLKVTPQGKRVFSVYYRTKGARVLQRRYKIGDYPRISVANAREMAKAILGKVASGGDPSAQRKSERHQINSGRVDEIVERFLTTYASKNRTASETERIFRRYVIPKIGKRSIHDLERADINDLIADLAETAPTMANRVLTAVRTFFKWAYSKALIEESPCVGISAPSRERPRDRLLSDDELARVMSAACGIGYPFGTIVEFLVMTGQRREEVGAARWAELDIANRTWTILGARSKNGKAHIVHLSDPALRILECCPHSGELVFSLNGDKPFQGYSKAKTRLDQKSSVSDWRLHDIRRTVVSGMARLGVAPHIADKVLNHQTGTMSSTALIYQRHHFLKERKDALDRWAEHVEAISSPPATQSPGINRQ